MSRGGYLNLWDNGNYDAMTQSLTVFVVAEDGTDDYTSIYADSDFAAANAAEDAENSGVPCEVRKLTLNVVACEVIYTAEP